MLANFLTDVRFAIRQMGKTPGVTGIVLLTIAFGVGATTAIFSLAYGVLMRPLPYAEPERLVRVFEVVPQYGRFSVAPANFLDWRQRQTVFERIAVYAGGTDTFVGPEGPERLNRALVSWDLFELLRVPPALGRGFRADEDVPNQNAVIILSHELWQRRFGGDPAVVGRAVTLSGTPVTIVGVMPARFYFPNREVEFWRPIALNPAGAPRGAHFTSVVARLKPGVTVQQAGAEMIGIARQLAGEYPQANRDESAETIALVDVIVGPVRPMLLTLVAAVGVVILIASANVANLLLVRASAREREIAIRLAMGAGGGRLVRQMLSESLVFATSGGSLGVLLAWQSIAPLQTLAAGSIPRVADVALDSTVLVFALLTSMAIGVLFGMAPAWHALDRRIGALLREGAPTSGSSRGRRLRSALLIAEVAVSIVLLVGAALLLRSFARLVQVEPGFSAGNVLTFAVALPAVTYTSDSSRMTFYDRVLDTLQRTPGVQAAGMVQQLPIRGDYMLSFTVDGRAPLTPAESPSANHRVVSPDYFAAMDIALRRGRFFTTQDGDASPMVALIDEAFALRHFANEDPIGRALDIGNGTDGFYRIVGIVGNVHHEGLDAAPQPTMYVPYKQDVFSSMSILVRTTGEPSAFAPTARRVVAQIDASLPAFAMAPLADVIDASLAERRFALLLLSLFAAMALFLAGVGLYGVLSYAVTQRTREIGLRLAIGAQPADVLRMVLGSGMKLAVIGVVAGLAGSLALSRLVTSMLFGVTPFDPVSYASTVLLLLAVAALACYLPARRAMAVDPLVSLRQQN
jgi:putative ABC transport system permease protein